MNLILINNSGIDKNWGGSDILASTSYNIQEVDRLRLISDPTFLTDLISGDAIINDGEYNLSPRVGLGVLKNDSIIMNEYYMLVQDDGVLMGNGKILYLHDDTWDTDDEDLEDDYPTEN